MNRREYLRALVAFGASSSLPAFAEGGPHRAAGIAEQRVAEKVFTTQSGTIGPPIIPIRLKQWRTYAGWLGGFPSRLMNANIIQRALDEAQSDCIEGTTPFLIAPVVTPREYRPASNEYQKLTGCTAEGYAANWKKNHYELLPAVACIGVFDSDGLDRAELEPNSSMTLVWFQKDFAFPVDLPSETIASIKRPACEAEYLREKITHIRIGLLGPEVLSPGVVRLKNQLDRHLGRDKSAPTLPDDENNYWAEAIEHGDKHFYRVGGTKVEITEAEFGKVIINPRLYYFSTALKLHHRVRQARETKYDA